jgi:hypothetical protein
VTCRSPFYFRLVVMCVSVYHVYSRSISMEYRRMNEEVDDKVACRFSPGELGKGGWRHDFITFRSFTEMRLQENCDGLQQELLSAKVCCESFQCENSQFALCTCLVERDQTKPQALQQNVALRTFAATFSQFVLPPLPIEICFPSLPTDILFMYFNSMIQNRSL